jgi:hypothetical protein
VGTTESPELLDGAVASAEDRQHRQIELAMSPTPADRFDDQDAAGGVSGLDAPAQDSVGVLVVPVVQDVAQQVRVRPGRERTEETAPADLHAIGQAGGAQGSVGSGRGRLEVHQMAAQRGPGIEDGGQQCAAPAADVDDGGEPVPVEPGDDAGIWSRKRWTICWSKDSRR